MLDFGFLEKQDLQIILSMKLSNADFFLGRAALSLRNLVNLNPHSSSIFSLSDLSVSSSLGLLTKHSQINFYIWNSSNFTILVNLYIFHHSREVLQNKIIFEPRYICVHQYSSKHLKVEVHSNCIFRGSLDFHIVFWILVIYPMGICWEDLLLRST